MAGEAPRSLQRIKETAHHTVVYGLAGALKQGAAVFLIPLYTRYLSPTEFGALTLLMILGTVASLIPQASLVPSLFRSYFDYDHEQQKRVVVGTAVGLGFILSGSITLVGGLFTPIICLAVFNDDAFVAMSRLILLNAFFASMSTIALGVLRAQRRSTRYSLVSLLAFVVQIATTILLVSVVHMGLSGVIWGTLAGSIASFAVALTSLGGTRIYLFSLEESGKMLRYGLPFIPTQVMGSISSFADRFFLQRMVSLAAVGVYSVGQKIGSTVSLLIVEPFDLIVFPMIFAVENDKDARDYYARILTYFTVVSSFVVLGLSLLSKNLLRLFAAENYWEGYRVVPFIALGLVLYGARTLLGVGLSLRRRTTYFPIAVGLGTLVNLMGLYFLVPAYHELGAAFASVLGPFAVCIFYYFTGRIFYPLKLEWTRILKALLAGAILLALQWLAIPPIESMLLSLAVISVIMGLFPLLIWALGFLDYEERRWLRSSLDRAMLWIKGRRE